MGVFTHRLGQKRQRRQSTEVARRALRSGQLQGITDAAARESVVAELDELHARGLARVMRVSGSGPTKVGLSNGSIWHYYAGDLVAYRRACQDNPRACMEGKIRLDHPPAVGAEVSTSQA